MTEAAKNRLAVAAVCVATMALSAALFAQWWPHQSNMMIETGTTIATQANKIVLNRATLEELQTLPLMTMNTAIAVLEYRHEHLTIEQWDELLEIDGVTAEMVDNWKTHAVLF